MTDQTCESCGYWVPYDPKQSGQVGECTLWLALGKASPVKITGGCDVREIVAMITAFDFGCQRWKPTNRTQVDCSGGEI